MPARNSEAGNAPPNHRRYLALDLPWLSAERAIRDGLARPDSPFALTERQKGAMRVVALSPIAAELGLRCGMALADARGMVPDLASFAIDREADQVLLDAMAHHCLDYTPGVMVDPPRGILLDIMGCEHLHGGEEQLCGTLRTRFGEQGFTARVAGADTPDAARALARHGKAEVEQLPVEALGLEEGKATALRRAGFRIVAELAGVSAASLAARFGPELPFLLDRLLGRADRHITPLNPESPVQGELRFAEPIGRHDDVMDAIESLVEGAAISLAERGQGGRRFMVRLTRSDNHIARLEVETGAPTRDSALVMRLFAERIDSLSDPLDPGFGYDSIRLDVARSEALTVAQKALLSKEDRHGDMAALLDRLAVRFGPASILRFARMGSHLPERAGQLKAKGDAAPEEWDKPPAQEPPLRPLFLFDPPQRVEVLASIPDGPPRRFRWQGKQHRVRLHEGPERIAPEWWNRRKGYDERQGFSRDYYRVEDEEGRRFWIFRHGLYERETDAPVWYVHGLFA